MKKSRSAPALGCGLVVGLLWAASAAAQTDEIQVYDGELAAPGVLNLTLHNNYVADGLATPAFAGAVTADRSWNGAFEWAFGVTRWFESGLYLPVYSRDYGHGWGLDGVKLRALFAVPDAPHRVFFYGLNLELSVNARRWDTSRISSELRPIVGWHLGSTDIVVNPILDTAYDGFAKLELVPVLRLARHFGHAWALAVEEYADLGPVGSLRAVGDQSHQIYAVVDHGGSLGVELGVGIGLTGVSDKLTFKLILSRDLNGVRPARGRAAVPRTADGGRAGLCPACPGP